MISHPGPPALSPVPPPLEIPGTLPWRHGAPGCRGWAAGDGWGCGGCGGCGGNVETLGTIWDNLGIYWQRLDLEVGTSEHLQDPNGQVDGSFCMESIGLFFL